MKGRKQRIAVISSNSTLSSFFELEAIACGCPVQIFATTPQDVSSFDLIILDLAAGYCFSEQPSSKIVAVVSEPEQSVLPCFSEIWEWPILVETVRSAYENLTATEKTDVIEFSSHDQPIIYLLPNNQKQVVYRNQIISLTESEWKLLYSMGNKKGTPLSREEANSILENDRGNIADVHICHLRQKLEVPFGIRLIDTVRKQGYALRAVLQSVAE
jgi:hypothetical protein